MKPSFQFHIASKRVCTSQFSVFFSLIKVKQAVELIKKLPLLGKNKVLKQFFKIFNSEMFF